ncbi:MAG: hypothetical protein JJ934_13005 [Pseudomonadales bacterium]|nr:hypothetical protein [Pseudomonadales bacterium]
MTKDEIRHTRTMIKSFRYAGLAVIFLWFFGGGAAHFTATDFFVSIVPPWVPCPLWVVYISGVIEIMLALLILWSVSRPAAGWGLIVLTIAVTPANIHMYLNPSLFPDGTETDYLIRLVVQVFLLALIWWSTRTSNQSIEEGNSH